MVLSCLALHAFWKVTPGLSFASKVSCGSVAEKVVVEEETLPRRPFPPPSPLLRNFYSMREPKYQMVLPECRPPVLPDPSVISPSLLPLHRDGQLSPSHVTPWVQCRQTPCAHQCAAWTPQALSSPRLALGLWLC